ncbi:MAG: hypothetical protein ABI399_02185 [Bauldia sp.]
MTSKTLVLGAMFAAGILATLPARAETAAPTPARAAVLFWLVDRNGDGTIDRKEGDALRAIIFDAIDLNHDGRLTADEAKAVADATRERVADRIAAIVKVGPAALAAGQEKVAERLGITRPDGLARTDFVGGESRMFAAADANGDGKISMSEFEAASGDLRKLIAPE